MRGKNLSITYEKRALEMTVGCLLIAFAPSHAYLIAVTASSVIPNIKKRAII